MRKPTGVVAALAVAGLAATNASAGQDVHAAKTTKHIEADANGGLTFSKSKLRVKHGVVKIVMDNPDGSGIPHGVAIRGHGIDKDGEVVDPGEVSTVKARLKKGKTYTFYCPFDGHAAAGMKGKLIVR